MKTVKKTLDILEVFLDRGNEVSISDLVEITGHNASTVHGILRELMQNDYIRQLQKRGKYTLGLKFLSYSDTINKMLAMEDIVNPFIVNLNRETDETVNVAIRNGRSAVNIAIMHSSHNLRVITNESIGTPLYCTGVGKILLSGMSDQDLQSYFKTEKLKRRSPKTIINKSVLVNQLKLARREGIANDDEEYELGVRNIAAAIKDHSGQVTAAIGIIGPTIRLTNKRIAVIAPLMLKTANQISSALGYSGIQGQRTRDSQGLA